MTTYFVDPTRPDDSGAGTSRAAAWKTFAHVNDSTPNAGDTIKLMAGTHTGTFLPTVSGADGQPISVLADDGLAFTSARGRPKSGAAVICNGGGTGTKFCNCLATNINYWLFEGFRITNYAGEVFGFSDLAAARTGHVARNLDIEGCATDGTDIQIFNVDNSTGVILDDCYAHSNGVLTPAIGSPRTVKATGSTDLLIQYLWSQDNPHDFVQGANTVRMTVEFCTCLDHHKDDVVHQDAMQVGFNQTDTIIRGNWFQDAGQLVYFATQGEDGSVISGIRCYSNVFVNHKAWNDNGSSIPHFFGDFRGTNQNIDDNQVFSNTFLYAGNTGKGIAINDPLSGTFTNFKVFNNLFFDTRINTGKNGVVLGAVGEANTTGGYNCFYRVNDMGVGQWANGQTGSITSDPEFVGSYVVSDSPATDPGDPWGTDFRLGAASPARSAGHPDLGSVVDTGDGTTMLDREGNVRLNENGSMGAYEFAPGQQPPSPVAPRRRAYFWI